MSDSDEAPPTGYTNKHQNRVLITVLVYISLLFDNILLTVIVPILPDYLAKINNGSASPTLPSIAGKNEGLHLVTGIFTKPPRIPGNSSINFTIGSTPLSKEVYTDDILEGENSSIGLLLAMKALVQLIFNPIVGNYSAKIGYRIPIVVGTVSLLVSSLVFGIGETYVTLLIARALQGIGSACIGVCGMSLIAQLYPEDDLRSKVMGITLGSIALGVLLGYPFGGILYDFMGKSAPFNILSSLIFIILIIQLMVIDFKEEKKDNINPETAKEVQSKYGPLLKNKLILAIVTAIWISTSTMAILEPCLPIWLLAHLKPKKWQLGTVFIPDSLGYFVGTNFFGSIAYNFGQIKSSCFSLILIGLSCIFIPAATTVPHLLLPHFCLGLGIGIVDAALVPLLASLVDANMRSDASSDSSYGTVYAIQQTSVSLAYSVAPLLGGELAESIGFPSLMIFIGILNIIYGPVLVEVFKRNRRSLNDEILLQASNVSNYKTLEDLP